MCLVYIDMMRLVCPGNNLADGDFEYYVLGEFDALQIKVGCKEIRDLQRLHKDRHVNVPVRYDRQPLYMYTPVDVKDVTIFNRDGALANTPMVISLFQLDDHTSAFYASGPEEIRSAFQEKIELIKTENPESDFSKFEYDVFWCLGASDCVVVFRDENLENIGKVLFSLRTFSKGFIRVLSTCSHFAYPKAGIIEKWLEMNQKTQLITLANTSYGCSDIGQFNNGNMNMKSFLFGEWDHMAAWDAPKTIEADFYNTYCISGITNNDIDSPRPFRTAYTFPIIQLSEKDLKDNELKSTLSDLKYIFLDDDWIKKLEPSDPKKNVFTLLANRVRSLTDLYGDGGENGEEFLADRIQSMGDTVVGLAKHLYRLLVGRFEQDLYAFVKPVFLALGTITGNTEKRIGDLHNLYIKATKRKSRSFYMNQIAECLAGYISDTSDLLSQLQHLFSVLSVSPHTFLETYGSNMRSVAAACKLIVAYQGIVHELDRSFSPLWVSEDGTPVEAQQVTLVLPYRNISTNNMKLYAKSDPLCGLSYIQIDFTDMFDIKKAVFVLLHECGHQLQNNRIKSLYAMYYPKAVFSCLLERAFGDYYNKFEATFQKPLTKKNQELYSNVPFDFPERSEFTQIISETVDKGTCRLDKDFSDRFKKEFYAGLRGAEHELFIKNDEPRIVQDMILQYLEEKFGDIDNAHDAIGELVEWVFYVYFNIAETILEKGCYCDIRCRACVFLKSYYGKADGMAEDRMDSAFGEARRVIHEANRSVCEEYGTVFEDIYSDVLTIHLLGLSHTDGADSYLEAKNYLQLLVRMSGALQSKTITATKLLIRVLAVFNKCFGIVDVNEICRHIKELGINDDLLRSAEDEVSRIIQSKAYKFVLEFTDECLFEIHSIMQRETVKTVCRELQNLYSDSTEKTIEGIFYFWKRSTQR